MCRWRASEFQSLNGMNETRRVSLDKDLNDKSLRSSRACFRRRSYWPKQDAAGSEVHDLTGDLLEKSQLGGVRLRVLSLLEVIQMDDNRAMLWYQYLLAVRQMETKCSSSIPANSTDHHAHYLQ